MYVILNACLKYLKSENLRILKMPIKHLLAVQANNIYKMFMIALLNVDP
jgi:hypothetical protein